MNIIKGGQIIRTSKNLRGILDYARVSRVVRTETHRLPDSKGTMRVFFADGAESRANFESYNVMQQFINKRRSWTGIQRISY